ncbi:hypothetical protein ROJ8625_01088 [Roseivivax jejudonensis]|uniref:Lipoprotein n=1 Tax=Roseivivax jejudonensis TaxID=1529041 RepID=A0A1X6YPD8_9RHOB|nr:hypothetical protein [Roseivivax jejudonensis]SLN26778.1 hypothetical protein ROJ8625_01088 [Roseivivax jejudonensis]
MIRSLSLVAMLATLGACTAGGMATTSANAPVTPSGCDLDVPNRPPGVNCDDDDGI